MIKLKLSFTLILHLRKELLKLRLEKYPIAIIQDLAKGEKK